jgi:hypothetical protein
MRIRRTIIAPVVLTIGTVSSLAIGPTMAILSTTAPAAVPVAAVTATPNGIGYHM